MLFYPSGQVLEDMWDKVLKLHKDNMLGILVKRSTGSNPDYNSKTGVIIVYTKDYDDKEDVFRVASVLREKLGYSQTMYYKTDDQTRAGLYAKYGSKRNHMYSY